MGNVGNEMKDKNGGKGIRGVKGKGVAGRKTSRVSLIDAAFKMARDVVKVCSTRHGLYASGGPTGYKGVWSRDSFITFLGASLAEGEEGKLFRRTFEKSLEVLGRNQSKKGQIPNAVHSFKRKKPIIDYGSIDSTLWYIIGHHLFKQRYGDGRLMRKYRKSISNAMTWLSYQDFGENIMLEQLPTTDWQDAFPQRYGRTINTQALYYRVLILQGEKAKAGKLRTLVNRTSETRLWNGDYYYAYRWKNHNRYKEVGDWFDSLGNLLAIYFGLASKSKSERIISYIAKHKINKPYPVRTIYPPIREGSEYWEDYYKDCDAGKPHQYLNGGIWTYIGGFYVLALIKLKMYDEARVALRSLAEANLKANKFPEWIDPTDKSTHGRLQAWSAGLYMLAYESLKKRKVLI
jgi:glycogen debranching enzyme